MTVSLGGIVGYFESLSDPRDARNRRHLLIDVIVITVCGVIAGCNGPTSIERWAKVKQEWLGEFLSAWASEHGITLGQLATEEKATDNDGTERADVRYFIVSSHLSGQRFAQSVRGHWGIENSLHWCSTSRSTKTRAERTGGIRRTTSPRDVQRNARKLWNIFGESDIDQSVPTYSGYTFESI